MINYEDEVLSLIDYGRLSFASEHRIFTSFIKDCLLNDTAMSEDEQEELLKVIDVSIARLEDYDLDVEDYKTLCWEKYDEHYQDKPRLSAYYRVLVLLFYEFTNEVEYHSEFTEIGLFLDCLDVLDETYPKLFFHKFMGEYSEEIEIL